MSTRRRTRPIALRCGDACVKIYQDMRAGDLVFFRPPDYPRHVGIYLREGQFVHASKSQGVIISPIDQTYWKRHFWTARRILTGGE
ncbi:MAG: NlpC/P60 family protein [Desulfobacterales bacterium]